MAKVQLSFEVEVTDKWLADCNKYWSMFSGFSLTPKQMLELFMEDQYLLLDSLNMGFDTGERERFNDVFSQKLVGQTWPANCESSEPEYEGFFERLTAAAKEAGYEFIGR
jgi:hypothetical protein